MLQRRLMIQQPATLGRWEWGEAGGLRRAAFGPLRMASNGGGGSASCGEDACCAETAPVHLGSTTQCARRRCGERGTCCAWLPRSPA
eukprot:183322-Chlamydomonas_euryale.AAC.1